MHRQQLFSLPQPFSSQNGEALAEEDVADAPVLAIKGARKGDRFVLAVVDPDAPDPVRARLGKRWWAALAGRPRPMLAPAVQLLRTRCEPTLHTAQPRMQLSYPAALMRCMPLPLPGRQSPSSAPGCTASGIT